MAIINCRNGNIILLDKEDYEKAKGYSWLAYKYENDDAKVFTLQNKKRISIARLIFDISGPP